MSQRNGGSLDLGDGEKEFSRMTPHPLAYVAEQMVMPVTETWTHVQGEDAGFSWDAHGVQSLVDSGYVWPMGSRV